MTIFLIPVCIKQARFYGFVYQVFKVSIFCINFKITDNILFGFDKVKIPCQNRFSSANILKLTTDQSEFNTEVLSLPTSHGLPFTFHHLQLTTFTTQLSPPTHSEFSTPFGFTKKLGSKLTRYNSSVALVIAV